MTGRGDLTGEEPPEHRPLSALRALRDQLPSGPEPDDSPTSDAPGATGPDAAAQPRLVVRRERKGLGGKTGTRVQGLALDAGARRQLAKDVKRALGCGARWEDADLLLQGDLVERAATWFEARGHDVVRGN